MIIEVKAVDAINLGCDLVIWLILMYRSRKTALNGMFFSDFLSLWL